MNGMIKNGMLLFQGREKDQKDKIINQDRSVYDGDLAINEK